MLISFVNQPFAGKNKVKKSSEICLTFKNGYGSLGTEKDVLSCQSVYFVVQVTSIRNTKGGIQSGYQENLARLCFGAH